MEVTWVALAASLLMGLGAACVFIYAVKSDYFHDLEDAKYQVFWSDLPESAEPNKESDEDGNRSQSRP
jgi:nitrogen fixation-related uncharacterized protein